MAAAWTVNGVSSTATLEQNTGTLLRRALCLPLMKAHAMGMKVGINVMAAVVEPGQPPCAGLAFTRSLRSIREARHMPGGVASESGSLLSSSSSLLPATIVSPPHQGRCRSAAICVACSRTMALFSGGEGSGDGGRDNSSRFGSRGAWGAETRGGLNDRLWAAAGLTAMLGLGSGATSSWALAASASDGATARVVEEPATSIAFPELVVAPGLKDPVSILGVGVRLKKIALISVRVYAVAFYAGAEVTELLKGFKGKSADQLSKDPNFFKVLVDAPVEKAIKIVLSRDVSADTFWNALSDALVPRLKALKAGPETDAALAVLGESIKRRALKKNAAICLAWRQPGTLELTVTDDHNAELRSPGTLAQAAKTTIESKTLLSALYDVYLGPKSVSPTLKTSVAMGSAAALNQ